MCEYQEFCEFFGKCTPFVITTPEYWCSGLRSDDFAMIKMYIGNKTRFYMYTAKPDLVLHLAVFFGKFSYQPLDKHWSEVWVSSVVNKAFVDTTKEVMSTIQGCYTH